MKADVSLKGLLVFTNVTEIKTLTKTLKRLKLRELKSFSMIVATRHKHGLLICPFDFVVIVYYLSYHLLLTHFSIYKLKTSGALG